ncbi:cytochrome P450 [Gordonia hankookensis]|uniref:Cytochrome P450 n=1 Tax=Gordonia hankookensis TaxID=589403 RepID=A0ABR7WJ36_9ACTN|nr:cytochrome P450 [Gordonia hankookensis]MBD1322591.1 cytochrome P450 [Gordonia hankookensis]
MTAPTIDEAARSVADPKAYADETRIHAALTQLRRAAPVAHVDAPRYNPFWAVTKHADIMTVERANNLFTNAPRPVLMTAQEEELQAAAQIRTLIHMDDPEHRVMRAVALDWFRPKALKAMKERIDELARIHVDKLRDAGRECDFVQEVAVNFPLFVIMSLLGVPESDLPRMLELTQELVGSQDSEFQRSTSPDEQMAALLDMFEYFSTLAARRRDRPTGDMASTIANAVVNGEPLGDIDVVSYYALIATAGHDTTTSTISGGFQALIEHPEERRRLTDDLDLMPTATEEMIRWVTPVKAFMRTAAEDTELGGVPIAAGDSLLLSYVSGNRDEDAFTDPFRFDVSREINKHVAFGFGVHFCLGAALARMEVNSFFTELLPRLKDVEPAGDPELTATTFVGGLKHLPIRYTLI